MLYSVLLSNNPSGSVEELHKIFSEFQSRVMEKEKNLREVRQLAFYSICIFEKEIFIY